MENVRGFRGTWALVMCFLFYVYHIADAAVWSEWFDQRLTPQGDNQSLVRIREVYGYGCPVEFIADVECRVENSSRVFSNVAFYSNNFLHTPCNTDGIVCLEQEQLIGFPAARCQNYQIRFLCKIKDSTTVTTELKNPLSVHGGFIAMAAGLSVVVPLVCVLFIQLRRARREERERRLRQNGSDQESGPGPINDPPPTYEQLFGPGYEPNLNFDRHIHGSSDTLIVEDDTGDGGLVNPAHQSQSADSDSGNDSGVGGDPTSTPPAIFPVSVISGNDVRDAIVTASVSTGLDRQTPHVPAHVVSLDVNRLGRESPPPPIPSSVPTNSSNSSSVSRPVLSSPSTRQSSSPASRIQSPSSSSNATNVPNSDGSSHEVPLPPPSSPPPPPSPPPAPQTQRMFPGMHISLQEFFSALRNQSDREPPPPSYEEALKILEKAEEAKRKSKK